VTRRSVVQRLAWREYAPLILWLAGWLIVIASVGHADGVRLLAAVSFVRSARYLTAPASAPLLRGRLTAAGRIHAPSARVVLLVELIALAGAAMVLAPLLALLVTADQQKVAILCLIVAAGLPAKALYPLAAARTVQENHRAIVAFTGLVLVALVWLADGSLFHFAAAFALREWVALPISMAIARPHKPSDADFGSLHWRQVASQSHHTGRRRFTYRFSKSLLKFVLGPFGSLMARTARGLHADRKLDQFVPQGRPALTALFLGLTAAGVALIVAVPTPGFLFLAATLMRIGSSAGNIVLWSTLTGGEDVLIDDAEDESDD
jgi:hypothetical protein